MIQLENDCLMFQLASGQIIPCSVERFTFELIGEAVDTIDPEMIRNAAAAVVHYYKSELNRTSVTVGEFTMALEQVLRGFGLQITAQMPEEPDGESDLAQMACECGKGYELVFFGRLRTELQRKIKRAPSVIRFKGLRRCVKQLVGAQRWSERCQSLNDQILEYLRHCASQESRGAACALVVR